MLRELIVENDPKSPISEIFRMLRTNIQFTSAKEKNKTILITSASQAVKLIALFTVSPAVAPMYIISFESIKISGPSAIIA